MRKVLPFVVGLAVLSAVPAKAEPVLFSAILQGTNENPMNASPGLGFALIGYDAAAHTLSVLAGFDDLLAGVTASHIHCCAAAPDKRRCRHDDTHVSWFSEWRHDGVLQSDLRPDAYVELQPCVHCRQRRYSAGGRARARGRHGQRPDLLQHSHDDVSRWGNQRNLDTGRRGQRRSRTRNALAGWRRHRGARRCQAPETRATVNLIQFDESQ